MDGKPTAATGIVVLKRKHLDQATAIKKIQGAFYSALEKEYCLPKGTHLKQAMVLLTQVQSYKMYYD